MCIYYLMPSTSFSPQPFLFLSLQILWISITSPPQIILLLSMSYTHMILFIGIKSRTHKKQDISFCLIGFIQLMVLSPVVLVSLKMTELWPSLWLKHLLLCIYHLFLTHSSLVGHLGWRHNVAIVNGVPVNIDVQASLLSVDLQSKT